MGERGCCELCVDALIGFNTKSCNPLNIKKGLSSLISLILPQVNRSTATILNILLRRPDIIRIPKRTYQPSHSPIFLILDEYSTRMTSCWRCCDCGEFVNSRYLRCSCGHDFCNHCWTVDIDQQQDQRSEVEDGILRGGLYVGFQEGSCSNSGSPLNTRHADSAYGSDLHSLPNLASRNAPSSCMVVAHPTLREDGYGYRDYHGLVTGLDQRWIVIHEREIEATAARSVS